jgi:hypothetical protein
MSAFINSLASSLLASIILISGGGVTPVLAQYSCPPREIQSVHEVGDLKFELQGCQRSGKKVICSAWVTDITRDNTYRVGEYSKTRLFDTSGEQYISSSNQPNLASLVKDVPMRISVTFVDVPTSVQDIALFEIPVNRAGARSSNGQFRNIKITESNMGTAPSPIKKKK